MIANVTIYQQFFKRTKKKVVVKGQKIVDRRREMKMNGEK
jgi:hypothetical protein